MTRTAIVTLSCPHCGGRTDGVRSIEAPQTIPCPYCRTELHVPRVGERVIERERIIERIVEAKQEEPNHVGSVIAVAIAIVVMVLMIVVRCASPSTEPARTRSHEDLVQQRQACTQQCVADCPTARETVSQLLARDADYSSADFNLALTRDRCVNRCETKCP